MTMLRRLRLRAITETSPFGVDLSFSEGLNVLRAGNTSGKSTCMQAIIYALGLERSLGPQLTVPLPYSMRERIQEHETAEYHPVLSSFVEIEIQNDEGEVVTVRRDVVGGVDPRLVQTWPSPALSSGDRRNQRDFYVHDPGAAQREDGFHHYLASFLGWNLPEVTRFDGTDCLLYLETIFPMFFVEQKRGWSSIQGPFPTFFRIQDVARRVIEFLLALDAGEIRRERTEIRRDLALVESEWAASVRELDGLTGYSRRAKGVTERPTPEFAHEGVIEIEIFEEGEWLPVGDALQNMENRLSDLEADEIPDTEKDSSEIETKLRDDREALHEVSALVETLRQDSASQLEEKRAIESRLDILERDLRRNQDSIKLRRLGSSVVGSLADDQCPTCHQEVTAELLPSASSITMALEENVTFLNSQIELYRASLRGIDRNLETTARNYDARLDQMKRLRYRIRELKDSLLQPASFPSRARVEEIVHLRSRIDDVVSLVNNVDGMTDRFVALARRWNALQSRLKELAGADMSLDDLAKIRDLEGTVRRHLERYGFRSFHIDEICLSDDNFRPIVRSREEDGNIVERETGFEVSASDAIRLKWAYYLGLLSVAQRRRTNHPGFVAFDEPGQQEIERISFSALLQWSSSEVGRSQQVILATSEDRENVEYSLQGRNANVMNFDGFILRRLRAVLE